MTSDWYKTAFGPLYSELYSHRNAEDARRAIEFILSIVKPFALAGPILDLCCGAGRHSIDFLSKIPDACITAFDLSDHLLQSAMASAHELQLNLPLVRGDMRALPFASKSFSLVMNLFTSFGYFQDEAENRLAIREASRAMKQGGTLIVDHINPAYLRQNLQRTSTRQTPSGLLLRESRSITRNRVEKETRFTFDGTEHRLFESVQLYEPQEMKALAEEGGLEVENTFGSFDGEPLSTSSPRAIYKLRKCSIIGGE